MPWKKESVMDQKTKFVHEAFFEGIPSIGVNHIVTVIVFVLPFLYFWELMTSNSEHPNELVYVVTPVKSVSTTIDHQDMSGTQTVSQCVSIFLIGCQCFADQSDVRGVASVVVHYDCAVGHPSNLVAVVPPGQDLGVGLSILVQPVVGFPEFIDDFVTLLHDD